VHQLAQPIPADTDIRIGEGQDLALRRDAVHGVQKIVDLLAGGPGSAGDQNLNVPSVRARAQFVSQRRQLRVGRVGFVLDHKEQMVTLVVLLEDDRMLDAKWSSMPLQGGSGPCAADKKAVSSS